MILDCVLLSPVSRRTLFETCFRIFGIRYFFFGWVSWSQILKTSVASSQYLVSYDLICDGCNFDFNKIYGSRGEGFIECHHKKPVSEIKKGEKTKLKDLIVLCSNCHRMIHRKKPWLTLSELKELIEKNHTSNQFTSQFNSVTVE